MYCARTRLCLYKCTSAYYIDGCLFILHMVLFIILLYIVCMEIYVVILGRSILLYSGFIILRLFYLSCYTYAYAYYYIRG